MTEQKPPASAPAKKLRAEVVVPGVTTFRRGEVVTIPYGLYFHGTGDLTLRVTDVNEHPHPGAEWLRVVGVEQLPDGSEGRVRDVMVRIARFPRLGKT